MMLDDAQRQLLLTLARQSIVAGLREGLRTSYAEPPQDAALNATRATFVTLRIDRALRGCCGSIERHRALAQDVWHNAWSSAFADPRFAPLTPAEYPGIDLHISALSDLEPLAAPSEAELLQILRPGVDGIVLRQGHAQSTFLPAVWEQLPDAADFIRHLKIKGGWTADFWSADMRVYRYTTESFGEVRD